MDEFQILEVREPEREEPMGSKPKFWWRDDEDRRWLFKYARSTAGEDWAEKIAAELAARLGLPCARAELAICGDKPGVAVLDFTDPSTELVHGNQLLARHDSSYPAKPEPPNRPIAAYTVERALHSLRSSFIKVPALADDLRDRITSPSELFVGYLLLDAWIGNGDRHHENWGILERTQQRRSAVLAPTYDHASSLGRELTDAKRAVALSTRDGAQDLRAYAARARSAFCVGGDATRRPISPLDAFLSAARSFPEAARLWCERQRRAQSECQDVLEQVPRARMSELARSFAGKLLIHNGEALQARIHPP